MPYVEVFARLLLGTVFAVAVAGKVSSRRAFAEFEASLRLMNVLPARATAPAARATAGTEALIVVLLLIPYRWAPIAGCTIAAGLLAVLSGAIMRSLRTGNRAPCRCFGASATPLGTRHLARNGLLLAIAVTGLIAAFVPGRADPAGALVAGAAGLVAGLAMTAAGDILDLLRPAGVGRG